MDILQTSAVEPNALTFQFVINHGMTALIENLVTAVITKWTHSKTQSESENGLA